MLSQESYAWGVLWDWLAGSGLVLDSGRGQVHSGRNIPRQSDNCVGTLPCTSMAQDQRDPASKRDKNNKVTVADCDCEFLQSLRGKETNKKKKTEQYSIKNKHTASWRLSMLGE